MKRTALVLASFSVAAVVAAKPSPAPRTVQGFPIGWCLRVQGTTLEEAKAAGFEYVELALQDVLSLDEAGIGRLADRLRALELPALGGYNLVPDELKLVGPEADSARLDQHVRTALAQVARLGIRFVVLGSGKSRAVPDGFPRDRAEGQLVDFCARLADEARPHGITVLVQPLRKQDTNLVNTVPEAIALVDNVHRPNFQMLVDYSFIVIGNEDPDVLRRAGSRVKHVWIANPSGRTYPMRADEADYASFFRALKAIGYRGGISVHARTDAFAADAPRAIEFLREMVRR